MNIELVGVQFENKGAELMLYAAKQQLEAQYPNFTLCLPANPNTPDVKRKEIGALRSVNLVKNRFDFNWLTYCIPSYTKNWIKKKWGLVFESDIDVVLDASGFAYGDQWNDLILRQIAQRTKRLKSKGKKVIFLPQALGPFSRESNRYWAKLAFSYAHKVFPRESISMEHLNNLNTHIDAVQMPDFTNLLAPPHCAESQYITKDKCVIIPNSKMVSRKNENRLWHENYIEVLATLGQIALDNGTEVVILNHSSHDDQALCDNLHKKLKYKAQIVNPSTALEVKALIGVAKCVVSSRYHGCISALSQNVPCLATGWSHKYQQLFAEYHVEDNLLSPSTEQVYLEEKLKSILFLSPSNKAKLEERARFFKSSTQRMWKLVFTTIK
ncbi:polysaccharide pyruvyl transferase family protein [Pseudoalteromonas pernae]|uniref:polysaccharide pyruvyl transferase family protein n=1 Tax=Pseudoalteromonas pernae TaxID=3118054 RepID=UPI003242CF43